MRPEHPQTPPCQFAAGKHALQPYQTVGPMGPTSPPDSKWDQIVQQLTNRCPFMSACPTTSVPPAHSYHVCKTSTGLCKGSKCSSFCRTIGVFSFNTTLSLTSHHPNLIFECYALLYEYWCLDSFSFVSGNCFTCQFGMTDASKYSKACEPVMVIPFSQHLCRWTQNTALYSTSSASTYLERGLCAGYRPLIGVKIWSTDIQPVPFVFTVKIGADVFLQEFGVKPGAGIFPTQ